MKHLPRWSAAFFALGIILLSAGPAPAAQPSWGWWHHGGQQNLTGQYSGTVSDSSLGTGTATGNFAGLYSSLGGYFGFTFGTSSALTAPATTYSSWNGIGGVFVATIGSTACTFAFQASYTSSSYQLNGTYKAVNGCSGENGTFSLTQQCYYGGEWQQLRQQGQAHKNSGLAQC
jgi:hypothetical protein